MGPGTQKELNKDGLFLFYSWQHKRGALIAHLSLDLGPSEKLWRL